MLTEDTGLETRVARLVETRVFAKVICEALGLDPFTVSKVVITIKAGEMPVVDVTHFLFEENKQPLAEVLKKYQLIPKSD